MTTLHRVEELAALAGDFGMTLLELAFAWLLTRDEVACVIAGAMTPEQVRANATAYKGRLSKADMARIDSLATTST